MAPDANLPAGPPERDADDARFAAISAELAAAVDAVLAPWIERLVLERVVAAGGPVDAEVRAAAEAAGRAARAETMPALRRLLQTDVDHQRTNPLTVLREATRHANHVLDRLDLPRAERDGYQVRSFPDDHHDLVPANWADVDPSLHELGITWGAAKAFVHMARRRREGMT